MDGIFHPPVNIEQLSLHFTVLESKREFHFSTRNLTGLDGMVSKNNGCCKSEINKLSKKPFIQKVNCCRNVFWLNTAFCRGPTAPIQLDTDIVSLKYTAAIWISYTSLETDHITIMPSFIFC